MKNGWPPPWADAGPGAAGPVLAGAGAGPGAAAPAGAPGVWAEHTAEPAHRARVVTNPNRFMNRLPARVLLEVCVEYRFAKAFADRLRMSGPCHSTAGAAELQGQTTRFGVCFQHIVQAADP